VIGISFGIYKSGYMKIGFDGFPFNRKPIGIGKYVLELMLRLIDAYPHAEFVVISNQAVILPQELIGRVKVAKVPPVFKRLPTIVWLKLFSRHTIKKEKLDYYFSTGGFLPTGKFRYKTVSVIHDFVYLIQPKSMGYLSCLSQRLFLKKDIRQADFIVCNSQGTAEKISFYTGIAADSIINPPIHSRFDHHPTDIDKMVLDKHALSFPYLLTVGTLEPRKNLPTTIQVYVDLKRKGNLEGMKLVIVGDKGWRDAQILELCNRHKDDIVRLGYVDDEDLPALYRQAAAFLYPSFYEGFGIPVREALLCECPVITSDLTELREASYNKAVYIDPTNKSDYEQAILKVLAEPKRVDDLLPAHTESDLGPFLSFFKQ